MGQSAIIVIDESAALRQQIRYVLSQQGYEIFEADNLRSGLKKIQEEPVCLIIVDGTLPDFSLPHLLLEGHTHSVTGIVPVLLLHSEKGHPGAGGFASPPTPGPDLLPPGNSRFYFLTKPFSSMSLMNVVKKALGETGTYSPHNESSA